jgi:hypothetical protein
MVNYLYESGLYGRLIGKVKPILRQNEVMLLTRWQKQRSRRF